MYEELIEELRVTAEYIGPNNYELPIMLYDNLLKAVDAIEERCQQVDKFMDEAARLYAKLPRWISVEERLPEQKKAHYLCLLDDDSMAVVYWSKVPDWASKGEWTWHNPNWKEVTHWMPLPEPPKEET